MTRPELVISFEGLKRIGDILLPLVYSDDIDPEEKIIYLNWINLFSKKALIITDVSYEEIISEAKNPFIKLIIKNTTSSGTDIKGNMVLADLENQDFCFSYFFSDKNIEECRKLSEREGLMFFNLTANELYHSGKRLFNVTLINISRNENISDLNNWNGIQKYHLECSCMVIIDNYFFKNNYEYNISQIFRTLIPEKLKNTFYLTIVTLDEGNNLHHYFNKTQNILNALNYSNVQLSIHAVTKEKIHDREIFTNYLWYHSGDSFQYFNNVGTSKNTSLIIIPYLYVACFAVNDNSNGSKKGIVKNKLNQIRNIVQNHSRNTIGNCNNPLLNIPE